MGVTSPALRIQGRVRLLELSDAYCPEEREFDKWWPLLRAKHARQVAVRHNKAVTVGLNSLAALMTNKIPSGQTKGLPDTWNASQDTKLAWMTARPYMQALGTSNAAVSTTDYKLTLELHRKFVTSISLQAGPLIVVSTYFTPSEVFSVQTTCTAASQLYSIQVASSAGFRVGDYIQIATTQGFEYHTINGIAGNNLTFAGSDSLVNPAMVGGEVSQCLTEGGMFGDEMVNPLSIGGKATVTNGSPTVQGSGTPISWGYQTKFDYFRRTVPTDSSTNPPTPPQAGGWIQIINFTGATQMTLASNWTETPGTSDVFYTLNGTMLNRTNNLKYVKSYTRGIVVENDWLLVGA